MVVQSRPLTDEERRQKRQKAHGREIDTHGFDRVRQTPALFYTCDECGALVSIENLDRHREWHHRQDINHIELGGRIG